MAKKSAVSKGYRKTIKKKPFLTKKEIIILCSLVAVIVVGLILFNTFYSDGYLRVKDVRQDDVVAYATSRLSNRYVKLAEAKQLDGFHRNDPDRTKNAFGIMTYFPDEPVDNVSYITLAGSYNSAEASLQTSMNNRQPLVNSGELAISERYDVSLQGHDAYVYFYSSSSHIGTAEDVDADVEEPTAETPNVFTQVLCLFIDAGDGYSINFTMTLAGEDDSIYLSGDEAANFILGYADQAITVREIAA